MRLIILESPYASADRDPFIAAKQRQIHIAYARLACRHALSLGDAPILSHLLYTQPGILDDNDPKERQWGIEAGLAWKHVAQATVVYTDYGISSGMKYGIKDAEDHGRPIEYRKIDGIQEQVFGAAQGSAW